MKNTGKLILTTIGVALTLGGAVYFPFPSIYKFVLDTVDVFLVGVPTPQIPGGFWLVGLPENLFPFRLKITLAALIIAAAIVIVMLLLRKACRVLQLTLFEKVLTWGMFYVTIMTVLVLVGLWLDLRIGQPVSTSNPADFCRVGFFFKTVSWH